ncbi:PDDEXK family nuclease [Konateibacter massiliensis]|uniref:DNA mismatch repair protein MutH n=1 Tax=Konateibacter massiliensis TaxID=2002841 RepID=UPI000C15ACCC|nr:DNA mismatch repair protein MutH [Konateibacter massiliensis]
MKLINAKTKINQLAHIPFNCYLNPEHYHNIIVNKGKTGQILELTIGLQLSNTTLDFEDGELKTNKCDRTGKPLETMFITQTASIIDELLYHKPFCETKLFTKLQHLLYVPISKDGLPDEWMYLPCIEVDLSLPQYFELKKQLEADYDSICEQMNQQLSLSNKASLHTVNGKFIQIRTKDSKPYTPIYSQKYGRYISDKNRAFYFKKEFMKYIVSLENK